MVGVPVTLSVFPGLPSISREDIIEPYGMLLFARPALPAMQLILFVAAASGLGFTFSARIVPGAVQMIRNGSAVQLPLPPADAAAPTVHYILLTWTPQTLLARIQVGDLEFEDVITTPLTYPPPTFIEYCERQEWIKLPQFETAVDAQRALIDSFGRLQDHFRTAHDAFWDGPKPKPEPNLGGTIEALLRHLPALKNLDIFREPVLSDSGKIDFILSSRTAANESIKLCMEIKKSTHADLEHGLTHQLPEYMRRIGATCGLFVVFDYGPEHRPAGLKENGQILTCLSGIVAAILMPMHLYIRVLVLPVFPLPNPSKL